MRYPTLNTSSLIESFFNDDWFSYGSNIDIYREADRYVVEVDLPGFDKEDIEIEFKGDVLSVKAELNEEHEDTSNKNYYYRSRSKRSFNKQIRFKEVDEDSISADYENGVLHIELPTKVKEEDMIKRIEVK